MPSKFIDSMHSLPTRTPFFLYDKKTLIERCASLASPTTRPTTLRYAMKANSNPHILRIIKEQGFKLDVVSSHEARIAKIAGFNWDDMVYTGDNSAEEEFEFFVKHNIHLSCSSLHQVELAAKHGVKEITLRINPGFGHGHHKKVDTGGPHSKHGLWHGLIPHAKEIANQNGMEIIGVHVHIGSGIDLDHLRKVAKTVCDLARLFTDVRVVNFGGGLPIPYKENEQSIDIEQYYAILHDEIAKLESDGGKKMEWEIEPGRFVVAECGVLATTIIDIKTNPEYTFLIVDSGFHHLIRPMAYGAYHHMTVIPARGALGDLKEFVVAGILCESGDVFTQEDDGTVLARKLPAPSIGDKLIIHDAGAYGYSMASNYNSYPKPAEYLWDGTDLTCIREKEF